MPPEEIVPAALGAWSSLNAGEIASYFAPDAMASTSDFVEPASYIYPCPVTN
jgi:hypothetical protein